MSPRQKRLILIEVGGLALLVLVAIGLWWRSARQAPAPPTATATRSATATLPRATPTRAPASTATATPTAVPTDTPTPTATPPLMAQVIETGGGLRLRATPGTAGEILRELEALAPLTVIGRTADNAWLEVVTALEERGWVSAAFVTLSGPAEQVAVTGTAEDLPSTGYLSGVSSTAREIFLRGRELGNRDFAFSVVGDSNTDHPAFLAPFDLGNYDLGDYAHLETTIQYFKGSFARDSAAAVGGFNTAKVLDPANADGRCQSGESPLACEYRLHQPSVALILLGTGDQHTWQGFEARYRQIIELSIERGVVPVLITKADDLESLENTAPFGYINTVIRRLAREYDVPLLDLRQAVEGLPNRGTISDGFHYNTPPDGQSAVFDDEHLRYGYTMRNLTALEALEAMRLYVVYAPLE